MEARIAEKKPQDSTDALMRRADQLLKNLPEADVAPAGERKTVSRAAASEAPRGARPTAGPGESSRLGRVGMWARLGLAAALGVLITQWPYAHACGLPLLLHFAAVSAVPIAGAWAAASTWKQRRGLPHVVAIGLVVWGLVLVAREMLPRTGYAAQSATWTCGAPR